MATPKEVAAILLLKAAGLRKAAGLLQAHGRGPEAAAALNEAINCENKANAINAGTAAFANFPTDDQLNQLQAALPDLQQAVDDSNAANNTAASLNKVAQAAANTRQSVPSQSIV